MDKANNDPEALPRKKRRAGVRGRLKRAVAKTAPQFAHFLGGPLAGAAAEALSRVILGEAAAGEPIDEEALAVTLEQAGPALAADIRRAEQEFLLAMREAAVEEQRLFTEDRADARRRQIVLDDWTPSVLGGLIIGGFFVVLGAMVARRLPVGTETEFSIMLGALATMTAAVVNYFFGSSAGSREKTRLLTPSHSLTPFSDSQAGFSDDRQSPRDVARAALFERDHNE